MPPVTRSQVKNGQATLHTVDASGNMIRVVPSATGQGVRTVWLYSATNHEVEKIESTKPVRANGSAWPTLSTLSSLTDSVLSIEPERPQTPEPRASWTPGSVVRTPKKLRRSPDRIGGHGIDFWRNGSGVIVQDIVDDAGASQRRYNNEGGSDEEKQSGRDSQNYMQQMKSLMERREVELAAWAAAHSGDHASMNDADVFGNSVHHMRKGQRLSPEDTVLIDKNASSYAGDTDIETDNEELDILQQRHNRKARALGLEPTILVGPGQYVPPKRAAWPRLNLPDQGGEPASTPLGPAPTELVL